MQQGHHKTESLIDGAKLYHSLGYSVIPVREDKRPISRWKSQQIRQNSLKSVIFALQNRADATGIGIVTGQISQLAVLDFDDMNLYDTFKEQFPDLVQTYTVRTRRGYHLYYRIQPDQNTRSRKCPGVDWLYNGRYVIAPPSIILGFTYQIEHVATTRRVSESELDQIHAFLDTLSPTIEDDTAGETHPNSELSAEQALQLYQKHRDNGRNNALFYVSLQARNAGWSRHTTMAVLLETFVGERRENEDPQQRLKEGLATITSAYSRPAQAIETPVEPSGLPNAIREALAQRGLTHAIRVIEGLRLLGIVPGALFSEQDAHELLVNIVGQHSIRKALTTALLNTEKVAVKPKTKCFEICQTKPKLNRGRPTVYYIMPSNQALATKLNVPLTRMSDPLSLADLRSVKTTRQALHREFIRRCPGIYPAKWLAQRIGISVRTKNRYDCAIPVYKSPTYRTIPLTFDSCGTIPEDDTGGIFLEDDRGQRYPSLVAVAKSLLKQGRAVVLQIQSFNFYSLDHPVVFSNWRSDPSYIPRVKPVYPLKRSKRGARAILDEKESIHRYGALKIPYQEDSGERVTGQKKSQHVYKVPLNDANEESFAQRIYRVIRRMGQLDFSLRSARRLVDQYGLTAVYFALKQVESKKTVSNPAGLLTMIAQSYDR